MVGLTQGFTNYARKLFISHIFDTPLKQIFARAEGTPNGDAGPKYLLYSAHDFQIANVMVQLKPELTLDGVPYASNVAMELWKAKDGSYKVRTTYNNVPVTFDTCDYQDFCEISQFKAHIDERLVVKPEETHQLCEQTPTKEQLVLGNTDWHYATTPEVSPLIVLLI